MSNISDLLLSIRALGAEDIRALVETSKKAISEEERRRLDSIPIIPEEDEAREIPVTTTYPLIYISAEDLKKATYKMVPNPRIHTPNEPKEISSFVQHPDVPVVMNGTHSQHIVDVSFVCYRDLSDKSRIILQGDSYNGMPIDTSTLKINSTRRDEKVVFVLSNKFSYQSLGDYDNQHEKGKFVVVTNFGNIHFGCPDPEFLYDCVFLTP
jgi:hypothetical protein